MFSLKVKACIYWVQQPVRVLGQIFTQNHNGHVFSCENVPFIIFGHGGPQNMVRNMVFLMHDCFMWPTKHLKFPVTHQNVPRVLGIAPKLFSTIVTLIPIVHWIVGYNIYLTIQQFNYFVWKQGPTRHRPMAHPVVFKYLTHSTTNAEHVVHRLSRCPAFVRAGKCLFLSVQLDWRS